MLRFVVRRLLTAVQVLLALSALLFAWLHALPGGPATAILGERATPERVAALNHVLHLDEPIYRQYGAFLRGLLNGDLGTSLITGEPVTTELAQAFPATIELAAAALVFAIGLGVPLGDLTARHRSRMVDLGAMTGTLATVAVPVFFLAFLLKHVFAVQLGWLPPSDRQSPGLDASSVTGFAVLDGLLTGEPHASLDALRHLLLPAVALGAVPMALIARITRAAVLDVLGADHVRAARAYGLAAVTVHRHVLRNAMTPINTMVGLLAGFLLSGAVLTEKAFNWGGLGWLMAEGIRERDYPRLEALILLGTLVFALVNLAVDLLNAALDPRVRAGDPRAVNP